MNDLSSALNYKLSIFFDIPEEYCEYDKEDYLDLECQTDFDYDLAQDNKWIVMLSNQKRFESDNYDGGHIVKET